MCCDGKGVCAPKRALQYGTTSPKNLALRLAAKREVGQVLYKDDACRISACWEKGAGLHSYLRRPVASQAVRVEGRRTLRDAGCGERALPAMSWRNSKAFHTLQTRMLMLMSAALVGALGVIIIAKDRGEFGMLRHTPSQFAQAARHSLMRHSRVVHARSSTRHSSHWVGSE